MKADWGPVEGGWGGGEDFLTIKFIINIFTALVYKGTWGLLQSKVHEAFFCFPFLHTEKFNTGTWLKDAILCDLIAFLMCCCFSFSFSKHTLDDFCLSLVFKSVLNSVTFDNCGRFWKCAKQKIMYGSSSSHTKRKHVLQALTTRLILLGFLDCKQKKVSLTLSAKWGSSFSLTVIDRQV